MQPDQSQMFALELCPLDVTSPTVYLPSAVFHHTIWLVARDCGLSLVGIRNRQPLLLSSWAWIGN